MSLTGQCLCGSVKYECAAAPVLSGNCHCKDCQRASGSAYAPTFFVPAGAISIQGEVKYYDTIGGSGRTVSRGFCPECGSPLFSKSEKMPGLIAVRAGSLDDPSQYHPHVDIYVSRAAPWDYISPSAITFPEMPPNPNA